MKICLVSQEYPPETARGGIGTQTYLKARGLAALGHSVTVVSIAANGRPTETTRDGVRVLRIASGHERMPIHTEAADWVTHSAEVAVAVSQLDVDLIEFADYGAEGYVYLLNRNESNRVPVAIQLHGPLVMLAHTIGWPDVNSELYRVGTHMESTCLRLADALYSSSRCSAQWVAEKYGLDAGKIPMMHAGVDTAHFAPRDVEREQDATVAFVGRIDASKGIVLLAEAMELVRNRIPDATLRVLGSGNEQLTTQLQSRFGAWIQFLGYLHHDVLPEALSRVDVLAAPSEYEGGPGFVYLEAMACGLPVIACRDSGASEAIVDQETGLMVDPGDRAGLAEALLELLGNEPRRRRMGVQGRCHVVKTAETGRCTRQIAEWYARSAAAVRGNSW